MLIIKVGDIVINKEKLVDTRVKENIIGIIIESHYISLESEASSCLIRIMWDNIIHTYFLSNWGCLDLKKFVCAI